MGRNQYLGFTLTFVLGEFLKCNILPRSYGKYVSMCLGVYNILYIYMCVYMYIYLCITNL